LLINELINIHFLSFLNILLYYSVIFTDLQKKVWFWSPKEGTGKLGPGNEFSISQKRSCATSLMKIGWVVLQLSLVEVGKILSWFEWLSRKIGNRSTLWWFVFTKKFFNPTNWEKITKSRWSSRALPGRFFHCWGIIRESYNYCWSDRNMATRHRCL